MPATIVSLPSAAAAVVPTARALAAALAASFQTRASAASPGRHPRGFPRAATPGAGPWRRSARRLARLQQRALAERGGGAVLDRPGFSTLGNDGAPDTDSDGSKQDASGGRGLGGGSWRVLLHDSDKAVERTVVNAIVAVVGTDERHATNVFNTARSIGQAIVTCAPKEHCEFYAQQLWNRGCKVSMEPDTTTV